MIAKVDHDDHINRLDRQPLLAYGEESRDTVAAVRRARSGSARHDPAVGDRTEDSEDPMLTEEARPATAGPAANASEPSEAPTGPDPPREVATALAERISRVGHGFPVKRDVAALTDELIGVLFPQLSSEPPLGARDVATRLLRARDELGRIAWPLLGGTDDAGSTGRSGSAVDTAGSSASAAVDRQVERVMDGFLAALPKVHERSLEDAAAILAGDPAAESLDEVIAAYPGFLAIATHRVAHVIHDLSVPLVPRLMAEVAHSQSGIDIHPGATIGRRFCIDHGTGVVVGETAVIGDDVKLYQGVTLGALSVAKTFAGTKRHPTIGDRVVIYANATVLGGDTLIGADSVIGGNVFLTTSVPPGSLVYQTSSHRVRRQKDDFDGADFVI
jgi:serine O-acetyltransferase